MRNQEVNNEEMYYDPYYEKQLFFQELAQLIEDINEQRSQLLEQKNEELSYKHQIISPEEIKKSEIEEKYKYPEWVYNPVDAFFNALVNKVPFIHPLVGTIGKTVLNSSAFSAGTMGNLGLLSMIPGTDFLLPMFQTLFFLNQAGEFQKLRKETELDRAGLYKYRFGDIGRTIVKTYGALERFDKLLWQTVAIPQALSLMTSPFGLGGIFSPFSHITNLLSPVNLIGGAFASLLGLPAIGPLSSSMLGYLAFQALKLPVSFLRQVFTAGEKRPQFENAFEIEREISASQFLRQYVLRILADQDQAKMINPIDMMIFETLTMIESHTAIIPLIYNLLQNSQEAKKYENAEGIPTQFASVLYKEAPGEKGFLDQIIDKLEYYTYVLNPIAQITDYIFKGQTPAIFKYNQLHEERMAAYYQGVQSAYGLGIKETNLLTTPAQELISTIQDPINQMVILLSGIYELNRLQLGELISIRVGLGISENVAIKLEETRPQKAEGVPLLDRLQNILIDIPQQLGYTLTKSVFTAFTTEGEKIDKLSEGIKTLSKDLSLLIYELPFFEVLIGKTAELSLKYEKFSKLQGFISENILEHKQKELMVSKSIPEILFEGIVDYISELEQARLEKIEQLSTTSYDIFQSIRNTEKINVHTPIENINSTLYEITEFTVSYIEDLIKESKFTNELIFEGLEYLEKIYNLLNDKLTKISEFTGHIAYLLGSIFVSEIEEIQKLKIGAPEAEIGILTSTHSTIYKLFENVAPETEQIEQYRAISGEAFEYNTFKILVTKKIENDIKELQKREKITLPEEFKYGLVATIPELVTDIIGATVSTLSRSVPKYEKGGFVFGERIRNWKDNIIARLTPGEFVIPDTGMKLFQIMTSALLDISKILKKGFDKTTNYLKDIATELPKKIIFSISKLGKLLKFTIEKTVNILSYVKDILGKRGILGSLNYIGYQIWNFGKNIKEQFKSLKETIKQSYEQGGITGVLGSVLGMIPGAGSIGGLLKTLWKSPVGKAGIVGTLIGAFDIFTDDSDWLHKTLGLIGMVAFGIAGASLGSALGPLGIVIGGFLALIGKTLGYWIADILENAFSNILGIATQQQDEVEKESHSFFYTLGKTIVDTIIDAIKAIITLPLTLFRIILDTIKNLLGLEDKKYEEEQGNFLTKIISSVVSFIVNIIYDIIHGIVNFIIHLPEYLMEFLVAVFVELPKKLIKSIGEIFSDIGAILEDLATITIGLLLKLIKLIVWDFPKWLITSIWNFITNIPKYAEEFFDFIVSSLEDIGKTLWDWVKGGFEFLITLPIRIWDWLVNLVKRVFGIGDKSEINAPDVDAEKAKSTVSSIFDLVFTSATNAVSQQTQSIENVDTKTEEKSFWDKLKEFIIAVGKFFWDLFTLPFKILWEGAKFILSLPLKVLEWIEDFFLSIFCPDLYAKRKELEEKSKQSDKNKEGILDCLWEDVKQILSKFADVVVSFLKGIWNAITTVFKWFIDAIVWIGEKIGLSFESITDFVLSVLKCIGEAILFILELPFKIVWWAAETIIDWIKSLFPSSGGKKEEEKSRCEKILGFIETVIKWVVKIPIYIAEFIFDIIKFIIYDVPKFVIGKILDAFKALFSSDDSNTQKQVEKQQEQTQTTILGLIFDWLKDKLLSVKNFFSGIVNFFSNIGHWIWDHIKEFFAGLFIGTTYSDELNQNIEATTNQIKKTVIAPGQTLSYDGTPNSLITPPISNTQQQNIEEQQKGLIDELKEYVGNFVDTIVDTIKNIFLFWVTIPKKIAEFLISIPKQVINFISAFSKKDFELDKYVFEKVKTFLNYYYHVLWEILNIPVKVIEYVINFFKGIDIIDAAKNVLMKAFEWVKGFIGGIINKIKGFFSWLFSNDKTPNNVNIPDNTTISITAANVILKIHSDDNQQLYLPLVNTLQIQSIQSDDTQTFNLSNIAFGNFKIGPIQETDDWEINANNIGKFIKTNELNYEEKGANIDTTIDKLENIYSKYTSDTLKTIEKSVSTQTLKQETVAKIIAQEMIIKEVKLSSENIAELKKLNSQKFKKEHDFLNPNTNTNTHLASSNIVFINKTDTDEETLPIIKELRKIFINSVYELDDIVYKYLFE